LKHRSSRYINNIIEQDHRRIKRKTNSILGFNSFNSASITVAGIEKQINEITTVLDEVKFIKQLFVVR